MNRGQLKTALKRYGFDDTDPLDTWVQAAYDEVLNETSWLFLEKSVDVALTAGQSTIALPSDFFLLRFIMEVTSGLATQYLPYVESRKFHRELFETTVATGQPQCYTLTGTNTLVVYPATNQARTYRVGYEMVVPEFASDASVPVFPSRFHYCIVHKAASIALMAENEEERAATALAEYDTAIGKMRLKYSDHHKSDPEQVEDVMDYGS